MQVQPAELVLAVNSGVGLALRVWLLRSQRARLCGTDGMTIAELLARLLFSGKCHSEEEYKEYLQGIIFVPAAVIVLVFSFELVFGVWFWMALIAGCAVLAVARRRLMLFLAAMGFISARFAVNLLLTQHIEALVGTIVSVGLFWLLLRHVNQSR